MQETTKRNSQILKSQNTKRIQREYDVYVYKIIKKHINRNKFRGYGWINKKITITVTQHLHVLQLYWCYLGVQSDSSDKWVYPWERVKPSNWGTKGYRGVCMSVAPSSGQVSRCSFLLLPLDSGELVNVSPASGDVTAVSEKRHRIHCHARPISVARLSEMKIGWSLWKPKSDCKPPALRLDSFLGNEHHVRLGRVCAGPEGEGNTSTGGHCTHSELYFRPQLTRIRF